MEMKMDEVMLEHEVHAHREQSGPVAGCHACWYAWMLDEGYSEQEIDWIVAGGTEDLHPMVVAS
jgi:hypothetical protein